MTCCAQVQAAGVDVSAICAAEAKLSCFNLRLQVRRNTSVIGAVGNAAAIAVNATECFDECMVCLKFERMTF